MSFQDSWGRFWVPLGELLETGAVITLWASRGGTLHLSSGLREVFSAGLWSPRWQQWLASTPWAPVGNVLLPESARKDRSSCGSLPPSPLPSHGPRLLPSTPSVATAWPLQAVSAPNPAPLPGTEIWSLHGWPLPHPQRTISDWGEQGDEADPLCRLRSILPSTNRCSPLSDHETLPLSGLIALRGGVFQGMGAFFPLQGTGPVLVPYFSFSLCPARLRGGVLVFGASQVFCQHAAVARMSRPAGGSIFNDSVKGGDLWFLLLHHLDSDTPQIPILLWLVYLWEEARSRSFYSAILPPP